MTALAAVGAYGSDDPGPDDAMAPPAKLQQRRPQQQQQQQQGMRGGRRGGRGGSAMPAASDPLAYRPLDRTAPLPMRGRPYAQPQQQHLMQQQQQQPQLQQPQQQGVAGLYGAGGASLLSAPAGGYGMLPYGGGGMNLGMGMYPGYAYPNPYGAYLQPQQFAVGQSLVTAPVTGSALPQSDQQQQQQQQQQAHAGAVTAAQLQMHRQQLEIQMRALQEQQRLLEERQRALGMMRPQ